MTSRALILAELEKGPLTLDELCVRIRAKHDFCTPFDATSYTVQILKDLTMEGAVKSLRSLPPAGQKNANVEKASTDRTRLLWGLKDATPHVLAAARPPLPVNVLNHLRHSKRNTDPHTSEKPQPIEILARMAGRSTFRTPRQPGATIAVPVTPLDIAHAIATAEDKLGSAMAMAMACQRENEWGKVELLGHKRVLAHLRAQRQFAGSVDDPHTYRARIALYDAFGDLVTPDHRRNQTAAARRARMRKELYRFLLRETIAYLEHAANTAAADAVRYLFALAVMEHRLTERVRAVSVATDGGILLWTSACAAEIETEADTLCAFDINLLCQDVLQRARRPGVLELKK